MFILKLIRFLQGYVVFQAKGDFIERFLNLLARDRIPVWDGKKRGNVYTGCVRASSYKKMRAHAKKTGVQLKVAGKQGAPFQRRKYRKRTGLLVGFLFFFAFLWVMSGFVWRIEINGNEKLKDSEVVAALERIGIKPGVWRASIDVRESERLAMLEMQDLSWIALNIDGSAIHVELSERTPPPDMVDPNTPCNVTAKYTGQIVAMQVYEGQALLQVGDTVLAGDILVSGITEDRLGQNLFRHARANITAQVELDFQVEVPLQQTHYRETGEEKKRRYLQVLSFDLPLHLPGSIASPYRVERDAAPLRILGIETPVTLLKENHILMEEVPVTYNEEQVKALALEELSLIEKAHLDNAEILQRDLHAWIQDNVFYLEASYICIMEIGIEQEIILNLE